MGILRLQTYSPSPRPERGGRAERYDDNQYAKRYNDNQSALRGAEWWATTDMNYLQGCFS